MENPRAIFLAIVCLWLPIYIAEGADFDTKACVNRGSSLRNNIFRSVTNPESTIFRPLRTATDQSLKRLYNEFEKGLEKEFNRIKKSFRNQESELRSIVDDEKSWARERYGKLRSSFGSDIAREQRVSSNDRLKRLTVLLNKFENGCTRNAKEFRDRYSRAVEKLNKKARTMRKNTSTPAIDSELYKEWDDNRPADRNIERMYKTMINQLKIDLSDNQQWAAGKRFIENDKPAAFQRLNRIDSMDPKVYVKAISNLYREYSRELRKIITTNK